MMLYEIGYKDRNTAQDKIPDAFTGSSRDEENDLMNLQLLMFAVSPLIHADFSTTIYPSFEPTNETSLTEELSEEDIISEMTKHDFIVHMSPVKEFTVRLKIKKTEKATLRFIEPMSF